MPPNRINCQNNFDNSCISRAAKWELQSGVQWNFNWYANSRKATKIQLHKQSCWEKLVAHRKSPGGLGNCVEHQIQTVCARGIALMFITNLIMNKNLFCKTTLFSNSTVVLVVDRNKCFIFNNLAQTNTKTRLLLHRCYGNTLRKGRLQKRRKHTDQKEKYQSGKKLYHGMSDQYSKAKQCEGCSQWCCARVSCKWCSNGPF